jgi:hypothetical protein
MPDRFSLSQSQEEVFKSGNVHTGKQTAPIKLALHLVRLSADERMGLERMIDQGKWAGSALKKPWILLKSDPAEGRSAWSDSEIAKACGVSISTVHRCRA